MSPKIPNRRFAGEAPLLKRRLAGRLKPPMRSAGSEFPEGIIRTVSRRPPDDPPGEILSTLLEIMSKPTAWYFLGPSSRFHEGAGRLLQTAYSGLQGPAGPPYFHPEFRGGGTSRVSWDHHSNVSQEGHQEAPPRPPWES